MHRRHVLPLALALLAGGAGAQSSLPPGDAEDTRAALERAVAQQREAAARSQQLGREAEAASDAADRSQRQAAAIAARIQETEAALGAAEARLQLITGAQDRLRDALGREQGPIVRLTAALQQFARRPVGLSLLRSGSVQDVVYLRAMLANVVPEIDERTAALRQRLAHSRTLQQQAQAALTAKRREEGQLAQRRQGLAALEMQQRLASRTAGGGAAREAERALALAEQARDLDTLLGALNRAGERREVLAALPGPVLRPETAGGAVTAPLAPPAQPLTPQAAAPPPRYRLPVDGRTVRGFGAPAAAGLSDGITLAPRDNAQVVAPAAGRVAFAGAYRGYDRIVIIEHGGGWTSLITGLAQVQVQVGDALVAGAPIGRAGGERPAITLELRHGQQPVNPLRFVR